MLSAERVALNYLCHLSGIATLTARYADAIAHTGAQVCCTPKDHPGLRAFGKIRRAVRRRRQPPLWPVRCRCSIKDNHIAIAGGVRQAISAARSSLGHLVKIEVEVDTLDQLREAMDAGPDVVMLDNMTLDQLREGVAIVGGRIPVEASGNVRLETIVAIAETGVDLISTSKITMSAPTLDLGLDIEIDA